MKYEDFAKYHNHRFFLNGNKYTLFCNSSRKKVLGLSDSGTLDILAVNEFLQDIILRQVSEYPNCAET
jgi:hypothetical protein